MSNQRMIVSTKTLLAVLRGAQPHAPVPFQAVENERKPPGAPQGALFVNGVMVGQVFAHGQTPWKLGFELAYTKARKLADILSVLEDQRPIILEWNGESIILHHVAV